MKRGHVCITFGLCHIVTLHIRDLLIMETRTVTGTKLVDWRNSYRGLDDLLSKIIGITSDKKSVDEKISPRDTNGYDKW